MAGLSLGASMILGGCYVPEEPASSANANYPVREQDFEPAFQEGFDPDNVDYLLQGIERDAGAVAASIKQLFDSIQGFLSESMSATQV